MNEGRICQRLNFGPSLLLQTKFPNKCRAIFILNVIYFQIVVLKEKNSIFTWYVQSRREQCELHQSLETLYFPKSSPQAALPYPLPSQAKHKIFY